MQLAVQLALVDADARRLIRRPLPMVLIVWAAASAGFAALLWTHLRRPSPILRRRGVAYAMPALPLVAAVPDDDVFFEGRAVGGLRVAVREDEGVVSGYEIALDGFPVDAVLRMRTASASLVLDRLRPDRVVTGDPLFDEAVVVGTETQTTHLRALLDFETRAHLQLAIGQGRVKVSGQKARCEALEAAKDSRLAERLIVQLASLGKALRLAPADVPARLLDIAQTDPVDAVRAACMRALLSVHGESPQALEAARLAHTVPDPQTHWMAAQVLGDAGLALAVSIVLHPQAAAELTGAAARWLKRFDPDEVMAVIGSKIADVSVADLQTLLAQPLSAAAGEGLAAALELLNDAQAQVVLDALGQAGLWVMEPQLIGLLRRDDPLLVEFALTRLAEFGTAESFEAIRRLDADGAEAALDRLRERLQAGGRLSMAAATSGALSETD